MDIEQMTDMPNVVTSTVIFPLYVTCGDYHEFGNLAWVLSKVTGQEVIHRELGCDGFYHGVVFLKFMENDPLLVAEMDRIEKTFEGSD